MANLFRLAGKGGWAGGRALSRELSHNKLYTYIYCILTFSVSSIETHFVLLIRAHAARLYPPNTHIDLTH